MAGAQVVLTKVPATPGILQTTQPVSTDPEGKFFLRNVAPGSYRLVVTRNGFVRQEYGAPLLNVTAGDVLKGVVVHLTPTGSVNGRITNSKGEPLMGMEVMLLRPTYDPSGRKSFQNAGTAQTNDRGEYRVYWIAPGSYYLSAGPSTLSLQSAPAAKATGARREKYVTTFYPGVPDPAIGVMIQIQPGQDLNAVDISVQQVPTYRIRGRIVGASAARVGSNERVSLTITPRQALPATILASPTENPYNSDGSFELQDIVPGAYWIRAQIGQPTRLEPGSPPSSSPTPLAAVDVVADDVENVILSILPPAALSGRVTVEGRPLPSDVRLSVTFAPAAGRDFVTPSYPATQLSPDGTFVQENMMTGEYQWSIRGLPSNSYVKDARFGATDVLGRTFRILGPVSESIHIDISPRAGQIEGVVQDDRRQPAAGATVALIPDLQRDRQHLYKSTTTDANGRFTLLGIAPKDLHIREERANRRSRGIPHIRRSTGPLLPDGACGGDQEFVTTGDGSARFHSVRGASQIRHDLLSGNERLFPGFVD